MTEEETRAIAFQDSLIKRAAYKAQAEAKLRGDPSAYQGLLIRMKAVIGRAVEDDGNEDNDRPGQIRNL